MSPTLKQQGTAEREIVGESIMTTLLATHTPSSLFRSPAGRGRWLNVKVSDGWVRECSHSFDIPNRVFRPAPCEQTWLQWPAKRSALQTFADLVDRMVFQGVEIPPLPTLRANRPTNADLSAAAETLNLALRRQHKMLQARARHIKR